MGRFGQDRRVTLRIPLGLPNWIDAVGNFLSNRGPMKRKCNIEADPGYMMSLESICSIGVPVAVNVQIPLNSYADGRVSKALTDYFQRNASLRTRACVRTPG